MSPCQLRLIVVFLTLGFCGCSIEGPGSTQPSAKQAQNEKLLGVTLFYRQDDFYRDLESGVRDAAKELGYELLVSDSETQVVKQASQVDNFIHRGVAGIIVCSADPNGIVPAIQRANAAGIPVITLDGAANGGEVVTHVGHDNTANGRAAGEYLVEQVRKQSSSEPTRCVILDYPQSAVVCAARVDGFKQAIGKESRIRVVAQQSGDANRAASLRAMSAILQANPQIDFVFGINDNTILGAMSAAQQAGRLDAIRFVSVSWSSEVFELLEKPSSLAAAVVTNPYEMGSTAVRSMADHLQGKQVSKQTLIKPFVFTHENIGQLDWRSVVAKRAQ